MNALHTPLFAALLLLCSCTSINKDRVYGSVTTLARAELKTDPPVTGYSLEKLFRRENHRGDYVITSYDVQLHRYAVHDGTHYTMETDTISADERRQRTAHVLARKTALGRYGIFREVDSTSVLFERGLTSVCVFRYQGKDIRIPVWTIDVVVNANDQDAYAEFDSEKSQLAWTVGLSVVLFGMLAAIAAAM